MEFNNYVNTNAKSAFIVPKKKSSHAHTSTWNKMSCFSGFYFDPNSTLQFLPQTL